jgi:hypothetical protein
VKQLTASLLIFLVFASLTPLLGQTIVAVPADQPTAVSGGGSPVNEAELASVREQLFKFLRMTPRLTMALSTDPTLLGYQEYVNKHNPELASFIQRHPEIARNPEFYLFARLPNGQGNNVPYLFQRAVWPEMGRRSNGVNGDLIAFFVFLGVVSAILWLLRLLLQNRRWNKIFRVQTEMHSKLLDKLGSNQELISYFGTDAGRRFLEISPIAAALESPRPSGLAGAVTRILAPLQFGIVSTLAGIGLLYIRGYFEDSEALLIVGTLALMLGIGLILSAGISWIIAHRFGLLSERADEVHIESA